MLGSVLRWVWMWTDLVFSKDSLCQFVSHDYCRSGVDVTMSTSPPVFQRSVSQPAPSGEGQGDIPSIWGSAPPAGW